MKTLICTYSWKLYPYGDMYLYLLIYRFTKLYSEAPSSMFGSCPSLTCQSLQPSPSLSLLWSCFSASKVNLLYKQGWTGSCGHYFQSPNLMTLLSNLTPQQQTSDKNKKAETCPQHRAKKCKWYRKLSKRKQQEIKYSLVAKKSGARTIGEMIEEAKWHLHIKEITKKWMSL